MSDACCMIIVMYSDECDILLCSHQMTVYSLYQSGVMIALTQTLVNKLSTDTIQGGHTFLAITFPDFSLI